MANKFFPVPAGYFGMPLGISAFGLGLRFAGQKGIMSAAWGEGIIAVAAVIWCYLVAAYIAKWFVVRKAALEEMQHTILCCFISLIPITTMLMGTCALPYSKSLAWVLWIAGIAGQLAFAGYRAAGLLRGLHTPEATTPILYLPTVAGNFVSASSLAAAGYPDFGMFFLGAGVLAWFSLESVILQRLRTLAPMPLPLRPSMGIQIAPALVGAATYLSVNGGTIDAIVLGLLGYGMLQIIFQIRLLPWVAEGGFTPSFWAYSFGLASLSTCGLRFMAAENVPAYYATLGAGMVIFAALCLAALAVFSIKFFATPSK